MVGKLFKSGRIKAIALAAMSLGVGAVIFFIVIGYSEVNSIIAPFKKFSLLYFLLFFITSFSLSLLSILRWQLIARKMGYRVPFWKLFMYRNMGFVIGYLTPTARMGGDPLRAMFLTKEHNVPGTIAYSSVMLDRFLDLSIGALVVTTSLLVSIFVFDLPPGTRMFFILLSFFVALMFSLCYYRLIKRHGFLSSLISMLGLARSSVFRKIYIKAGEVERIASNFFYYANRKHMIPLVVISVLLWLLFIAEFKFALMAVGYNATILQVFLVIVFTGVITMLPVPASLGVLEAGQASAFTIMKAGPSLGIALALIIRARDMIWVFFGLILLSRKGLSMAAFFNNKK